MPDIEPKKGGVEVVSPEQYAKKLEAFRSQAVVASDTILDGQTGIMYVKGRHPTLVGVEATIAIDTITALMIIAQVIPTVVVPIIAGKAQVGMVNKGKPQ